MDSRVASAQSKLAKISSSSAIVVHSPSHYPAPLQLAPFKPLLVSLPKAEDARQIAKEIAQDVSKSSPLKGINHGDTYFQILFALFI